ncbi:bifunctional tetrahydrofolate synthase/dihydrofolate synthase [Thioflexithrix psekupsensis]|uniref:Dihydrofolate synthase/folylpolyglutamate synthase n=1 Tax=Thioflexithrix psekupsensis TaxID=1570016 RepID=A0A251X3J0_9GAMM|nr:bifunctional tetrahydrofolate synthase/dihydrofolate synthase [Thioflexithrix psekupsensis]OUD11732.1 bifunctional tetrahydrofolate synthase/dihydrofolate synthase [Thioflexithrix psekupsensis]
MRFKTLIEWLNWQNTLHPHLIDLELSRCQHVAELLDLLPFPCPVITVGGTNGKGSCVTLLEAILRAEGYRTAHYLSPHLLDFTERLCFDHQEVTEADFCRAFAAVDAARGEITLTSFEFITLAALWLIREKKPDVAILEVGLGGRLDVVNLIDPQVALITNVALDHTEWLGETREKIGFEKAGILRPNGLAVYGEFNPPLSVLRQAEILDAQLYYWQQDFHFTRLGSHRWTWWCKTVAYDDLPLPALSGEQQLQNAANVLMVLTLLRERLPVSKAAIIAGLTQARLLGRLQCLPELPRRLFDVAHNAHGAVVLRKFLQQNQVDGKTHALVGIMRDKDIHALLSEILAEIDVWHIAAPQVARAATVEQLEATLQDLGAMSRYRYDSVAQAYEQAVAMLGERDQLVVFGSFFTVAEALRAAGFKK